jgi:DNA-binding NtrC family response regulator
MTGLKKRILVVDDDQVIRDLIISFLTFSGYEAQGAQNGQEGLDMALQNQPDLIITDIHMPLMNGFQLLKAVKKIGPDIPVIFITGYAHLRRFFSEQNAQADGFLEKPFNLDALNSLVMKFIG